MNFPRLTRCGFGGCFASRTRCSAISSASFPERRTTAMPPRPGGVAMATMVSSFNIVKPVEGSGGICRRIDNNLAGGTRAFTHGPHRCFVLQRQVDNPSFARAHGSQVKGAPGLDGLPGGHLRRQPQFFHATAPPVPAVKADSGIVFIVNASRFQNNV